MPGTSNRPKSGEARVATSVGIIPSLIIGVREGIEAALVIGIILGYLVKIGRLTLKRHVYAGTIVAFFASAGVAAVLFAATVEFQGFGEQIFEGVTMLVAVAVLTSMVLWMMKAARSIKVHVQERIEAVLKQSAVFGLTLLSFVVVFREGVETALFMFGAGAPTPPLQAGFLGGPRAPLPGGIRRRVGRGPLRGDLRRVFLCYRSFFV